MIRCVVFDFDGVLVDSNAVKQRAYHEIFASEQRDAGAAIEAVLRGDVESDRYGIIRQVLIRLGAVGGPRDGALEVRVAEYADRYNRICEEHAATCPEVPGASAALRQLSTQYPLYVISATPEAPLRRIVERRGWLSYFRSVLGRPRDKRQNLALVLERERVSADTVILVGDGRRDLEAARGAGCRFIGVRNHFNDFDPRGLLLLDDLRALPAQVEGHVASAGALPPAN
jgi:phosphoglycolate phosphatase-like HAD superfamily hydrolase